MRCIVIIETETQAPKALADPSARVLYLPEFTDRTSNPCLVWRAEWPTKHLPDHGIEAKILGAMEPIVYRPTKEERKADSQRSAVEIRQDLPSGESHAQRVLETYKEEVDKHDVVIFGRTGHNFMKDLIAYARSQGKKVGYEVDDLTFGPHSVFFQSQDYQNPQHRANIEGMVEGINAQIKDADFVIASTPYLVEEAAALRGSKDTVFQLKNRMDLDVVRDVMPEISHTKTKDIRIGYASSAHHAKKILLLKPVFEELHKKYGDDVVVVVKGFHDAEGNLPTAGEARKDVEELQRFFAEKGVRHEFHPYTPTGDLTDYYKGLADLKLDIMLNPQDDDPYHEGKSELKYLEAAVIGAPIVTPVIGGCGHALAGTRNGVLIDRDGNSSAYVNALSALIENPRFRQELAMNARAHLLSEYDAKKSSRELADIVSRVRSPSLDTQVFCLLNEGASALDGNAQTFKDSLRPRLESMRDSSGRGFTPEEVEQNLEFALRHMDWDRETTYEDIAIDTAA